MDRKKFITLIPTALLAAKAVATQTTEMKNKKMLIIYYSWSGNTRYVANLIKNLTNADILEISPETPYPTVYRQTVDIAKKEVDADFKRPIKTKIPDIGAYDIIFIGSPNWWGTISSPIRTVLSETDFSGKKIVPFMTHEGSRMGRAVDDIKKLCPKSEILTPLPIRGGSVKSADSDVSKWLKSLNL